MHPNRVVPCAGTWIETATVLEKSQYALSFPVRERGLKLLSHSVNSDRIVSFPVRERGLKRHVVSELQSHVGRSLCGNVD